MTTTLRGQIRNKVAGDALTIRRTVLNVPSGQALTTAYFTVKVNKDDADPGVFQKTITTTPSASGQITDDGSGDGTGVVEFELAAADTILCTPEQTYSYDIQVVTDAGKPYTIELGTARFKQGVTAA